MPKRRHSEIMSTTTRYKSKRRPKVYARRGYSSVPRTRGWVASKSETKYFDTELAISAIPVAAAGGFPATSRLDPTTTIDLGSAAVPNPQTLCVPTVGSALNQRIGRKIKVMKIKVRGNIYVAPVTAAIATGPPFRVRLVLLQDKQTNASWYVANTVFNPAGSGTTAIAAYQNPNSFGRYRILKDKMYSFGNQNFISTDMAGQNIPFKFSIKFRKPVLINFNATNGGTVSDIVDNSFHVLAVAENIGRTSSLNYYCRVAYCE